MKNKNNNNNNNNFTCLLIFFKWMLQIPGATSYIGCIGKDKFGEEMKKSAKLAGIDVSLSVSHKSIEYLNL